MSSAGMSFGTAGVEAPPIAALPRATLSPRAVDSSAPWRAVFLAAMVAGAAVVTVVVAGAVESWVPACWILLPCVALTSLWISGGAAAAVIGLLQTERAADAVPDTWRPARRTAVLVLLCGEPAADLAGYLRDLRRRLNALRMRGGTTLFVLSDTRGDAPVAAEEAALAGLVAEGSVVYRRRPDNVGRKPGNISDWLGTHGDAFDFMLVLDADSRMSARRIRALVYRMELEPALGLLQAGIAMVPGRSVFGRHQRRANALLSPNFGRGLAAWSGRAGNYWGHNAIARVQAFREAADLPVLTGTAPFGGQPLSHDFIEAAWIRRAGWSVVIDPDARGSAEDGPQTLREFFRRDRRWCQGNLQHLRLIAEPGLDPVSRLHLALGIAGYLVAPLWLLLVLLVASQSVAIDSALPLALITLILLVPKACALLHWYRRARTAARRRRVLRTSLQELLLSSAIAPLVMLRQSGAVLAVCLGRDCGWKSPVERRLPLPCGVPECVLGAGLLALVAITSPLTSTAWLLPIALPLIAAPLLHRWLGRGAQ